MGVTWDTTAPPRFETGVSRGTFFPNMSEGYNWNGLVSVSEQFSGIKPKPIYMDGRLIHNKVPSRNFQGKIKAYSVPDAFRECAGEVSVVPGFILANQPRTPFHFTYETNVGLVDHKLHFIYNATATPTRSQHQTIGSSTTPSIFEWTIDTVPIEQDGYPPTSHFVVDSSKMPTYIFEGIRKSVYGREDGQGPTIYPLDYFRDLLYDIITEPLTEPI